MMIYNSIIGRIAVFLPRNLMHLIIYNRHHKHCISIRNPKTYDEKIHYLIANVYDESYGKYADKFAVRDYVEECGLEDLLIPLIGVWDDAKDIDFDTLPKRYVLKANHGSGTDYYEIVEDNDNADHESIRNKFRLALKLNYVTVGLEYHYSKIKPRIICEKILVQGGKDRVDDYKVICSHGKAKAILVCTGRNKGRDYYSTEWEYLDYVKDEYKSGVLMEKPESLKQMIDAAEKLSKPFPLARIDFYIINDRLFFGEITLTPSGGTHYNLTDIGQKELGEMISL